jgi:hypothetical protein
MLALLFLRFHMNFVYTFEWILIRMDVILRSIVLNINAIENIRFYLNFVYLPNVFTALT